VRRFARETFGPRFSFPLMNPLFAFRRIANSVWGFSLPPFESSAGSFQGQFVAGCWVRAATDFLPVWFSRLFCGGWGTSFDFRAMRNCSTLTYEESNRTSFFAPDSQARPLH